MRRALCGSKMRSCSGWLSRANSGTTLAGQEDEHVAAAFAPQLVDRLADRIVEVEIAPFLERPPALLHRIEPSRHRDHRRGAVA